MTTGQLISPGHRRSDGFAFGSVGKSLFPREFKALRRLSAMLTLIACSAVFAVQMFAGAAIARSNFAHARSDGQRRRAKYNPGQYIVVFKEGTSPEVILAAQNAVKELGGTIKHTYSIALIGFSVADLPENALRSLRAIAGVALYRGRPTGAQFQRCSPLTRPHCRPAG